MFRGSRDADSLQLQSRGAEPVTVNTPLLYKDDAVGGGCFRRVPWQIVLCCAALILFSSGEQVLRKIVATNMYNYRWFIVQILSLGTCLVAGFFVLLNRREIRETTTLSGLPLKTLLYMAVLDSVHSMCFTVALGVLPGPLSVIIPQTLVPLVILFRFFSGGQSCRSCYAIGALVVLAGVLLSFLPGLVHFEPCLRGGRTRSELIANIVIMFIGIVPAAASAVYKQSHLQDNGMNIHLMNFVISLYQIILGLMLAPIVLELQFVDNDPSSSAGIGVNSALEVTASAAAAAAAAAGRSSSSPFYSLLGAASSTGGSGSGALGSILGAASGAAAAAAAATSSGGHVAAPSLPPLPSRPVPVHPVVPPSQALPTALMGTDSVSRNLILNFKHGLGCLFGQDTEFGDLCSSLSGTLALEFCLYIVCIIGAQIALIQLLQRVSKEAHVQYPLAASVAVSFVFFFLPFSQDLLPAIDGEGCLSVTLFFLLGGVCTVVGLVFSHVQETEKNQEIDIWGRILEMEQEEKEQEEREREIRERERSERREAQAQQQQQHGGLGQQRAAQDDYAPLGPGMGLDGDRGDRGDRGNGIGHGGQGQGQGQQGPMLRPEFQDRERYGRSLQNRKSSIDSEFSDSISESEAPSEAENY